MTEPFAKLEYYAEPNGYAGLAKMGKAMFPNLGFTDAQNVDSFMLHHINFMLGIGEQYLKMEKRALDAELEVTELQRKLDECHRQMATGQQYKPLMP